MKSFILGPVLPANLVQAVQNALNTGDGTEVANVITKLCHSQVVGVIIYGTAMFNQHTSSDVDLLILTESPVRGGAWGNSGDVALDAHIEPLEEVLSAPKASWQHVEGGHVLYDREAPRLKHWLQSLSIYKERVPDPWSEAERLRDRVWARRMLDRVAKLAETDPDRAILHESTLIAAIPSLYAQQRHRHDTSISRWWASPLEPEIRSRLRTYREARGPRPDVDALRDLLQSVLDGEAS